MIYTLVPIFFLWMFCYYKVFKLTRPEVSWMDGKNETRCFHFLYTGHALGAVYWIVLILAVSA